MKNKIKRCQIMNRESAKNFIENNVLGSHDVQEFLMVNRSRLKALVDAQKLIPIKKLKGESLFLLCDVEELKNEMLSDTRTNLYKMNHAQ
jgi:hypothetical protein